MKENQTVSYNLENLLSADLLLNNGKWKFSKQKISDKSRSFQSIRKEEKHIEQKNIGKHKNGFSFLSWVSKLCLIFEAENMKLRDSVLNVYEENTKYNYIIKRV